MQGLRKRVESYKYRSVITDTTKEDRPECVDPPEDDEVIRRDEGRPRMLLKRTSNLELWVAALNKEIFFGICGLGAMALDMPNAVALGFRDGNRKGRVMQMYNEFHVLDTRTFLRRELMSQSEIG